MTVSLPLTTTVNKKQSDGESKKKKPMVNTQSKNSKEDPISDVQCVDILEEEVDF